MNVLNLLVKRQHITLDQMGTRRDKLWPEATWVREASQVSGDDANILGTLTPLSACLLCIKEGGVRIEAPCPNPQLFVKLFSQNSF